MLSVWIFDFSKIWIFAPKMNHFLFVLFIFRRFEFLRQKYIIFCWYHWFFEDLNFYAKNESFSVCIVHFFEDLNNGQNIDFWRENSNIFDLALALILLILLVFIHTDSSHKWNFFKWEKKIRRDNWWWCNNNRDVENEKLFWLVILSSFMTSFIHRRKFTVVIQKKALFWGRIGCRGHFMEFLRIWKENNL